jgi:hypothetical protein
MFRMIQLECYKSSQIEKIQINYVTMLGASSDKLIGLRRVIFRMKYVQVDSLECSKLCQKVRVSQSRYGADQIDSVGIVQVKSKSGFKMFKNSAGMV